MQFVIATKAAHGKVREAGMHQNLADQLLERHGLAFERRSTREGLIEEYPKGVHVRCLQG
jgi:hypothetical protein